MLPSTRRLAFATIAIGVSLLGVFVATVVPLSTRLRGSIRQAIIERDAAVLHPVAVQQLDEFQASTVVGPISPEELIPAVLKSARQPGMLAVAVFDADGELLQAVPESLLLPELAASDYLQLQSRTSISRFRERFPLDRHFPGIAAAQREAPVLEVLLALRNGGSGSILGFAHYLIDARSLAQELDAVDGRIRRLTLITLGSGAAMIGLLGTGTFFALRRAHRLVAERSERLARANFELTLAAKASAVGQITSHLLHGLQGPVAGLRAVVAAGSGETRTVDWQTAADYTARLDALIRETITLLSDASAQATYELSGQDLVDTLQARSAAAAAQKNVNLIFTAYDDVVVDNHRGGLLCLIVSNLVDNAIEALPAGGHVEVNLGLALDTIEATVRDNGPGIPESVKARLFEPGCSGREGGTGLGLAISRLLARQVGGQLALVSSDPSGTTFRVVLPLHGATSQPA